MSNLTITIRVNASPRAWSNDIRCEADHAERAAWWLAAKLVGRAQEEWPQADVDGWALPAPNSMEDDLLSVWVDSAFRETWETAHALVAEWAERYWVDALAQTQEAD